MAKQAKAPAAKEKDNPEPKEAQGAGASVKRFKVGRGSTRRITNALTNFDEALAAFIKEMDLQFYEADEDGNRVAEWDFVSKLQDIRKEITETVNDQIYPAALDEAEGE